MKFAVKQDQMLQVLTQITGVLERTQTRDVLSHARVKVDENGELLVSCTDVTMTMVAQLQADQVDEAGGTSIPGLRLFNIFRALGRSEPVVFETVEEMIRITSGRSEYELNVMTGPNSAVLDGYLPTPPEGHLEYKLTASQLHDQLMYTNPVMGTKGTRQYLVATCFELSPTYFRTVSTEASVLAMATSIGGGIPSLATNGEDESESEVRQFVVPRKTVLQVTSMCNAVPDNEMVTLAFGENHFSAKVGRFTLTSSLIDTKYPDYEAVFPKVCDWNVVCDRERLCEGLTQVEVVAIDSSHRVHCEFDDNVLAMRSASTRNDRVSAQVALDSMTDGRQISLHGEKFLRVLSSLSTPKVKIGSSAADIRANVQINGVSGDEGQESESKATTDILYMIATMSDS